MPDLWSDWANKGDVLCSRAKMKRGRALGTSPVVLLPGTGINSPERREASFNFCSDHREDSRGFETANKLLAEQRQNNEHDLAALVRHNPNCDSVRAVQSSRGLCRKPKRDRA